MLFFTSVLKILGTVIFALFLGTNTTAAREFVERGVIFKTEAKSILLDDNPIADEKTDSMVSCARLCGRNSLCNSANFKKSEMKCSLLKNTRESYPEKFLKHSKCVYLEKVPAPGSTQMSAVPSCQALAISSPYPLPCGIYWIDPDGGTHCNAFQAYCDMDTDGGGWTLVWSYTFTNYAAFKSAANAVTPQPDWPVTDSPEVPISTVPPLSETDYNAVNFSVWKQLGKEVLIKSNINNWLTCTPNTGSLVEWRQGKIDCAISKEVVDIKSIDGCSGTAPVFLVIGKNRGVIFKSASGGHLFYYFFYPYTSKQWPAHDPCGAYRGNHLKNVQNPHGNIFIR